MEQKPTKFGEKHGMLRDYGMSEKSMINKRFLKYLHRTKILREGGTSEIGTFKETCVLDAYVAQQKYKY